MLKVIEVAKIYSSSNVRDEKDDSILELMQSIEAIGLMQPITVRPGNNGQFEVIAGHRRLEAVKRLGEPFIECNVMEDVNNKDRYIMQLEENIQRKDMSAYELVKCFDELHEKYGATDIQIAKMLNKSKQWVYDNRWAVKLLEKEYQNGIPEDKKAMSYGMIKASAKRKQKIETKRTYGKGFTCDQKQHVYWINCSSFEFEQALNQFLESNR